MATRKWPASLMAPLLGLTACTATPPDGDEPLAWLGNADIPKQARQQARAALARQDYRLLALPRRGLVIPGVDARQTEAYRQKCGVRLLTGAGDAVRDSRQRAQLSKARDYATAYNRVILQQCRL